MKQTNNLSSENDRKRRECNSFHGWLHNGEDKKEVPTLYEIVSGQGDSYMTVDDYTTVWTEQVDRGGLCHVSSGFFRLVLAIEYVCRKFLDIRNST